MYLYCIIPDGKTHFLSCFQWKGGGGKDSAVAVLSHTQSSGFWFILIENSISSPLSERHSDSCALKYE